MLTAAEEVADNGALSSKSEARHATSEPDEQGDSDKAEPRAGRELSVAMLIRELVFCAALALTTYGALHNSPPRISKHPQAVRFFPDDSPVADWHRGQLKQVLAAVGQEDVSLVMYYAPWDAECQHVRREIDIAARLLNDQVYFAAINCWNPGSECRLQHDKIPSFPVIMAYSVNSKGVLYRGPRDAHSIVKFLELIMRPMRRVSNVGDLVSLVSICDAVAVGFTPLSSSYKDYNVWYSAALKAREVDPLGEICFAVVTSEELAADLGVSTFPALRYMLWNETLEYEKDSEAWEETALVGWVARHIAQPATRITPLWQKAFSFQRLVEGRAMLVLFTPLEPLYERQPAYDLLREVAMEYYDCDNSEWTQEIIRLQQLQRLIYQQKNTIAFCRDHKLTQKEDASAYKKVLSQYKTTWHNATYKSKQKHGLYDMLLKNNLVRTVTDGKEDTLMISPLEENVFPVFPVDRCEATDKLQDYDTFETASPEEQEDELSAERLAETHMEHYCRLQRFAVSRSPPFFPRQAANYTSVHGLACRSNATLNFLVIDSIRNHHFAESLGIDIDKREHRTAVVILDSKVESQYELQAPYGEASIRDFIRNYTARNLTRQLRSHVSRAPFTHYYGARTQREGAEGAGEQREGAVGAGEQREGAEGAGEQREGPVGAGARKVVVEELTSRTFGRFVKKSGEVGIVLVCGGMCPSHASRAALSAARLLAGYSVRTRVARVDALRHDLPWQYTASVYPTIHVLPADRRLESSVYPASVRVSTDALVALVMRTLGPPAELRVHLAMCNNALFTEVKKKCLSDMRSRIVALIGRTLKHYQRASESTRAALLPRLEHLRELYWALHSLHLTHISKDNESQSGLIDSLKRLEKTWNLRIPVLDITRHSS